MTINLKLIYLVHYKMARGGGGLNLRIMRRYKDAKHLDL